MTSGLLAPLDSSSTAEVKTYLRLDGSDEDELLERLLKTSIGLCETFIGQKLLLQRVDELVRLSNDWRQLSHVPVLELEGIDLLAANGTAESLTSTQWQIDIQDDGVARVRKLAGGPSRARITYLAGMADTWASLPDSLRHGIVRLAAHLYTYRDAAEDQGPPAVVAALWRPWRRYRLN